MMDKVTDIVDKMKQLGFDLIEQRIQLWIEDLYYLAFFPNQRKFGILIFGNKKMSKLYCYGVYNNFPLMVNTGNIVKLISFSKEINNLITEINKTREILAETFPGLLDASEDIIETYNQLKKNNVLEVKENDR